MELVKWQFSSLGEEAERDYISAKMRVLALAPLRLARVAPQWPPLRSWTRTCQRHRVPHVRHGAPQGLRGRGQV